MLTQRVVPTRNTQAQRQHKATRELASILAGRIRGEVRFDTASRALYATDHSIYRQVPIGVVLPRDKDDVIATVATCREHGARECSQG